MVKPQYIFMDTKLTDKELIQAILDKNDWTQQQLADVLLFNRSQVSHVLRGRVKLRPVIRAKAEQLLAEASEK